eukprot:m.150542 g.150542  ORF g.150542 m.150542 type:complete len:542 (+) comp14231_c0_seq1:162-1787(+)
MLAQHASDPIQQDNMEAFHAQYEATIDQWEDRLARTMRCKKTMRASKNVGWRSVKAIKPPKEATAKNVSHMLDELCEMTDKTTTHCVPQATTSKAANDTGSLLAHAAETVQSPQCCCGKPHSRLCRTGKCTGAVHASEYAHEQQLMSGPALGQDTVPSSCQLLPVAAHLQGLQAQLQKQQRRHQRQRAIIEKAFERRARVLEQALTARETRPAPSVSSFQAPAIVNVQGRPIHTEMRQQQEAVAQDCGGAVRRNTKRRLVPAMHATRDTVMCFASRHTIVRRMPGQHWFSPPQSAHTTVQQALRKCAVMKVPAGTTCPICLECVEDEPLTLTVPENSEDSVDSAAGVVPCPASDDWVSLATCVGQHPIHRGCLQASLMHSIACPVCTIPAGPLLGPMPDGTMSVSFNPRGELEGGVITISYAINSGTQDERHPHPGSSFSGTFRTALLPGTPMGFEALGMLQQAWDQRLLFRVGTSMTTGMTNTVIWNDIHHKTSLHGGATGHGYPDPTYLDRLMEEMAANGIRPYPNTSTKAFARSFVAP